VTASDVSHRRGTTICRGCGHDGLESILDLGRQPLSNELPKSREVESELFPLHLRICPVCGLGQVGEYVLPDRIFGDEYPYLSSTSTSWLAHARRYADDMSAQLDLGPTDLVVEIASNDGYLLSRFRERGTRVLGVEPASNVAAVAESAGVPTLTEFFGSRCARKIVGEHGHPRLVVANNVMAHVPDLHDFVTGLGLLCDENTVVTIENPSLMSLLLEAQFDTIYHEHFSYLTAHSVLHVAGDHGLDLVRVETLPTHGGSNRYFIRKRHAADADSTVPALLEEERNTGLFDRGVWDGFAAESQRIIADVRRWLEQRQHVGARVAGYGAAAKGNTLLNAVGAAARSILFVADASSEKQGRFLPGLQIPISPPSRLAGEEIDDVLILPWNLASELLPIVRDLSPSARVWVPRPHVERLA
jgi:hypothetical protein